MGFDELYEENVDAVYGYLMFKLRNEELVEDLLQDTFLAVYQSLETVREANSPKAWILSVAQNKMVDYLRKKKPIQQFLSSEASFRQEPVSDLFLKEILSQLEGAEQSIIYGLYVEDLGSAELAEVLNIPEGTVKSKAYYARKKLRRWLREVGK